MYICAGRGEEFDFAYVVGVGLIESAIKLTQLCLTQKIKEIIFLGSAGAYDNTINIGDVFCATQAAQIESSFFMQNAYTPLSQNIEVRKPIFLNVSYETAVVNSSNYITTESIVAQKFFSQGFRLENMEFFSIVQVANYFQIPCLGIFCVSNYCNAYAHKDFLHNHSMVKQRLESVYYVLQKS